MSAITDQMKKIQYALGLNQQFVQEMESKSQHSVLTAGEVQELRTTKDLMENQTAVLAHLEAQAAREVSTAGIDTFVEEWPTLMEQADQDDDQLAFAVAWLAQAVEERRLTHVRQEAAMRRLPAALRERIGFPSWPELAQRLAGRLPTELASVVDARPLTQGELRQVKDADIGTQDITRIIARYRREVEG